MLLFLLFVLFEMTGFTASGPIMAYALPVKLSSFMVPLTLNTKHNTVDIAIIYLFVYTKHHSSSNFILIQYTVRPFRR